MYIDEIDKYEPLFIQSVREITRINKSLSAGVYRMIINEAKQGHDRMFIDETLITESDVDFLEKHCFDVNYVEELKKYFIDWR